MATINLGKVITDQQKEVLNKQSYDSVNSKLVITGDENVEGNFTADSIIENMEGYSFRVSDAPNLNISYNYAGIVKTGNKLTIAIAGTLTKLSQSQAGTSYLGVFEMPRAVADKLYPATIGSSSLTNVLSPKSVKLYSSVSAFLDVNGIIQKNTERTVRMTIYDSNVELNTPYYFRIEETFLLSDSLAV